MNLNATTTADQDIAIGKLRKQHNRSVTVPLTAKEYAEMRLVNFLDYLITEAAAVVDRQGLLDDYSNASPAVRSQVDTLLGR